MPPHKRLRLPAASLRSLTPELTPAGRAPSRGRSRLAPVLAVVGIALAALLLRTHGTELVRAIDRALHASWHLVAVAVLLEAASIAGYVFLLHRVVSHANPQLRVKDSYDITLGGAAAARLLPTAGLGGAAVTVWALRARGVRPRELGERLLAFLLLLYAVYMLALLVAGACVGSGLIHVVAGRDLGILGAALAVAVTAAVLILFAAPSPVARVLDRVRRRSGQLGSAAGHAADQLPVLEGALRRAWRELRRPHPALIGAAAWWGFDVGVLVALLHAFGVRLPLAVVLLAYFLGTLFNLVPLPGSLSGGLVGCLIALGSPVGGTLAAVLAYRTLAVWLPAAPGVLSLAALRRSVASWRRSEGELTAPSRAGSPYRSRAFRRRQCKSDFPRIQGAANVAK